MIGMNRFKGFSAESGSEAVASTHWHIVLALKGPDGRFGAIGLSRRNTLDYKEIKFLSLSELILDYREAYHQVGHSLRKIYVGLPGILCCLFIWWGLFG